MIRRDEQNCDHSGNLFTWELDPLHVGEVPETAQLLADAMDENPSYAFLFPRAARRNVDLARLFRANLHLLLPASCTQIVRGEQSGALLGTISVLPPGGVPRPVLKMIQHGLLRFAWDEGLSGLRRLEYILRRSHELECQAAKSTSYWYLHMVAVRPENQGGGLGSRMVEQALTRVIGARSEPCVLSTHSAANVAYFERFGFEVSCREEMGGLAGGEPFTAWFMVRKSGVSRLSANQFADRTGDGI